MKIAESQHYPPELEQIIGLCMEAGWAVQIKREEHGFTLKIITDDAEVRRELHKLIEEVQYAMIPPGEAESEDE